MQNRGAEEPQVPSGLLPPQACNTGPLGDPDTRALMTTPARENRACWGPRKKERARFTAVGMTSTWARIVAPDTVYLASTGAQCLSNARVSAEAIISGLLVSMSLRCIM